MSASASAYDAFAWVYDRHWGPDIGWKLEAVRRLALDDLPPPRRVLDLCCGTGHLDRALGELGYAVTGVDASPAMIRLARDNAPACEFVVADVGDFRAPRAFDLALCMFDSLNHLMTEHELRRAFRAIHGALEPGARFLFDLNMEAGYRERWQRSAAIVEDDHVCVMRSRFLQAEGVGEYLVTVFRRQPEWVRADITFRQRCYAPDEITRALAAEGFSGIRVLDAVADLGLAGHVGRSVFVCDA